MAGHIFQTCFLKQEDPMQYMDIRFPHLGIVFSQVPRSFHIGSFEVMFYGLIVASAFFLGFLVARLEAEHTGQNPEIYLDFFLSMMIPAIVGARLYYVIFSWDYYKDHFLEIFNLRQGGLGVVGGVAASALTLFIFCRIRGQNPFLIMDTLSMGLLCGQMLGRWGNFFNREAFGGYTDGFLAMQIPLKYFEHTGRLHELAGTGILDHLVSIRTSGESLFYIQVHPAFLYEGLWNLLVLLVIFFYRKHKKADGELIAIYFIGYGIGRFMIESLRVDQLLIGHTGIPATQVVCILIILLGAGLIVFRRRRAAAENKAG